jgi:hypothetical protein
MAFLFVFYAVAMGAGTFVESAYNTDTARILVYNAWWFEGIILFFMIVVGVTLISMVIGDIGIGETMLKILFYKRNNRKL